MPYKDVWIIATDTDFWHAITVAAVDYCATVAVENPGTNEVQSVTTTGGPTGGTFTLTFGGQTTAPLARNVDAPSIQAALEALASIGAGGVRCTGGPLPTAILVEFRGPGLAATNVPLMTHTDSLTGGASPAAVVTATTQGAAGVPNHVNRAALMRQVLADPDTWGKRMAYGVAMLGGTTGSGDPDHKTKVGQIWDAYSGVA